MDPSEGQAQSVERDEVEDILVSFREWLSVQEARWRCDADQNEFQFHISPSIAPEDPLIKVDRRQAKLKRRSVGRRVFRKAAWGFIFTVVFSAAFAWKAGDEQTKDMIRGWGISLSRSLFVLRTNLSSGLDIAAETISQAEHQPAIQNAAQLKTPASPATGLPAELQEQLKTIENNIADVQRIVEKLAATQAQMGQDIALLQGTQQNVVQKIAAISRSPSVHVPAHKNKSLSVPVMAPANQAPLYLH